MTSDQALATLQHQLEAMARGEPVPHHSDAVVKEVLAAVEAIGGIDEKSAERVRNISPAAAQWMAVGLFAAGLAILRIKDACHAEAATARMFQAIALATLKDAGRQ